jgi:hypothetical protein
MPQGRVTEWADILDVKRAVATATTEMFGDWLRDPWSWPELKYLANDPSLLVDRLNSRQARFERLSVPKVNFGTRPAVVQDPVDRVVYHAVVNSISARVTGDLAPFVRGWRLSRTEPKAGLYLRNQQEWLDFIASRREAVDEQGSVLATDITNFFGSVDSNRLSELVFRKAGNVLPANALHLIISSFNALPDRSGIPQRSVASSVLANAYLGPIDDLLSRYASMTNADVARWMDDVWVFGGDHEQLRCLQLDLQDELRNLGLEINLGKTRIREGDEARSLVEANDLEREPPTRVEAASGMPYVSASQVDDLDRQFELLVERPELADRTAIRYVCRRAWDYGREDLVAGLVEITPRAPQGADHFSRLFGRSGYWRELPEWFVELSNAPVGLARLPWPIAQLGTMFPSDETVGPVAELFGRELERSKSPPVELLSVAAHRLSKWNEADARVLLRSIGAESDSPLCRRTSAIALHNLGEDHTRLASMLSEFEENRSTKALLEECGNRPIKENPDFDLATSSAA